ncbi:MAG TPA: S9 family peptidase [Pyrinomonadaceae bacterium]|nr:S9 family peptidase [Pyrinomonadaceae bacterium]
MKGLLNCLFLVSFVFFFSVSAFGQTAWTPELQIKTRGLGGPRVSPDGKRVVYTVSDAVMTADRSEYVSQIWMATADGKENVQMTFGEKSSTSPKWSPDGMSIAFLSNRKDNRNGLYVMRIGGGESEAITDVKAAISDFEWSPDGKSIAFAMSDPKSDDEDKNDKAKNDFRWMDENVKMSRLYVVLLAKDANGKREPRKLTAENYSVSGFNWSPDGTKIVFSYVKDPRADYWTTSDVSIVDVASGKTVVLANTAAAETSPEYSPDGKSIVVTVSDLPVRWAQSGNIVVYPSGGGAPKAMALSYDGQPNVIGWSPDGTKIMFTESKGTGTALYEADVAAGTVVERNYQDAAISSVNMTKIGQAYALAMVVQKADAPPEVFALTPPAKSVVQVSHANDEIAKMPTGKTELIKWKSKDGREIEGLLTYPVGYVAGTKVPFILNVHGGPAGVFTQSYLGGRGVYPLATFASRGFAILRPNPRGSSGYGTEFRRANIKDWGGQDYQDLMTGVDKVIEMGVADPERLGVMGWSYGGYMTSWIITQTKRFKAASAGAPVTNLMSFNGTADIPAFVPDYFGGQSWEIPEVYAKHSAMFNIKGVTTPTLIEHGDADVRVPISQGYELYNALRQQGVPTRMIVLPRQPHGPTEPKMQLAAMQANLDWFEKYLK